MVEQQADALSGDGPALEDHLDAPLHEHVEQRGAVELLHAQERPLQRDRGGGCGGWMGWMPAITKGTLKAMSQMSKRKMVGFTAPQCTLRLLE